MVKKYIYLVINGLSLSNLKTKFVTSNFKSLINWLDKQKKESHFVELEVWKVEDGVELNKYNMIYVGDAEVFLKIIKKNKQIKQNNNLN